jgi:cobalamin biosynthesis protein CobT
VKNLRRGMIRPEAEVKSEEKREAESESEEDTAEEKQGTDAKMIRRLMCESDSEEDGLDEEPWDVLKWTLSVTALMPDLGLEEENYSRNVDSVIKWKEKTIKAEFDRVRGLVSAGGKKLKESVRHLSKVLLRNHGLMLAIVSAITIKLMT